MKLFASSHNCITIVGDPDQSIYGWRAAGKTRQRVVIRVPDLPFSTEIENLDKMKKGKIHIGVFTSSMADYDRVNRLPCYSANISGRELSLDGFYPSGLARYNGARYVGHYSN